MSEKIFTCAAAGIDIFLFTDLCRPFVPHMHGSVLAGCLMSGSRVFTCQGFSHAIEPGELVLLPPWTSHACTAQNGEPAAWIGLHIGVAQPDACNFTSLFQKDSPLAAELFTLASLARSSGPLPAATIAALRDKIMALPEYRHGQNQKPLSRITDYMRARWNQPLALERLAAIAGREKYGFLRSFKAATGLTPHRYQENLRLDKARLLLRKKPPLSEIAVACGYCDQSHFNRYFKANIGVTPGAFRKASGC